MVYSSGDGVTPGQNYELIGTVSFGYIRCGYPGIPDGYARWDISVIFNDIHLFIHFQHTELSAFIHITH